MKSFEVVIFTITRKRKFNFMQRPYLFSKINPIWFNK